MICRGLAVLNPYSGICIIIKVKWDNPDQIYLIPFWILRKVGVVGFRPRSRLNGG